MNLSLLMPISQTLSVVPAGQVASAGQLDAQLFTVLARMAKQRVGNFNSQELANTAWALTDSASCTLGSCRSGALGG